MMANSDSGLNPTVIISQGNSRALALKEIERLRHRVWSALIEHGSVQRFSLDNFDAHAWHFAIRESSQILATARLTFHPHASKIPDLQSFGSIVEQIKWPCCFFGRMVVDPRHPQKGLSRKIDEARIECARKLGAKEVWIEVEQRRSLSLHRAGFITITESDDTSIPGHWLLLRKTF